MSENLCGNCTACCRVFAISEVEKDAGEWCKHCAIGSGCKIYDSRPDVCREFECAWLISQRVGVNDLERLGPELRPDRCKIVFSASTNENIMAGTILPGHAHEALDRKGVRELIAHMVKSGLGVVTGTPASTTRTMHDRNGTHEVHLTPPDASGMQWSINPEDDDDA